MKLTELEALAKAATPGPWSNCELENMEDCILGPDDETWVLYNDEINTMKQEDSDFVTAANPATIIELIALVRLQHGALKALSMKQSRWTDEQIEALDAFDKLEGGE